MATEKPGRKVDLPDGVALVATLRGHTGNIGRMAWSPDGRLLATPSEDDTVRIWDGSTGEHLHTISAHKDDVDVVAFDRTGKILATAGDDDVVKLWRVDAWTLRTSLKISGSDALAFSPRDDLLAIGGMQRAQVYDIHTGRVRYQAHKQDSYRYVDAVAFDPAGDLLASGGDDRLVKVRTASDGRRLVTLKGHKADVYDVAFTPDGRLLVSCARDNTIKVWDHRAGRLLTTLESHTDDVSSLSFAAGGRLMASKGTDGTVRLWDCATWAEVGLIREPDRATWQSVAFHPTLPILATTGREGSKNVVHLWRLDPDLIIGRSRPASVTYTSAKIVLVGDSGVGKTGLGYRLANGRFKNHPSTHGQQFWVLDDLGGTRADGAQCEAILWDLAGQPDYRLIHALFLDDADIALVLFDPTRDDDPLRAVDYWLRQLGTERREVVLVAARADRGSARLAESEIAEFCAERGVASYVTTSAFDGTGIEELMKLMRAAVRWDERPTTVTTATFKWIKDTVLTLKEAQRREPVILSPGKLRERLERDDPTRRFTDREMRSAVGHLANHGYVAWLRTSTNKTRILLAPELLNNIAASIVLEARRNPKGLGSLEERRVLAGAYAFPELQGLSGAERDALLDSAVALFLKHNVCFRETDPLTSRVYLVFPELINLKRPVVGDTQPVEEGAAYTATGAVENVYASLVVLLGYTGVFARTNQWRSQAEYTFGDGLVCGFRMEAEREGELDLVLHFGANVGEAIRRLFQSLFESFLARPDLTVRRYEPIVCGEGHRVHRAVVRERLTAGADDVFCTGCGERLALPQADEPIQLARGQAEDVRARRRAASQRSRFEEAVFKLKTYVIQDDATQPTCFISYAWGDPEQERWVARELATDLVKAGITVILDQWDNARIGASVPRFVERVESADRVVVVGTPRYRYKYDNNDPMRGFVLAAEGDLIGKRMIGTKRSKETVLPIILEGSEEQSLPPLLHGRVYCDFRRPEAYFEAVFDLILSLHEVPPTDIVAAELRSEIVETPK
ncbi:TIR domain-containing protein [Phytohabitans flavus]|uniref:WD40 domain-containing protein n=1 Tax=Phytohabitans flavus TaxID=1076124 RepID=UPI003633C634